MTSTARGIGALGLLGLALACGGGSEEKPPAPPPWETAWSAQNGAELGPHLERLEALRIAFNQQWDEHGDAQITPLSQPATVSKTAMLITEPALLEPMVNSGGVPTISLDAETNPRLDQLTALHEGGRVNSFFSVQRANHLLWELQATQVVVILDLETQRDPEILDERSFAPGLIRGTAHVFDYTDASYLGRAEFSATNSPEVSSFSEDFGPMFLSLDLHNNTQRALGSALQRVFPQLTMPPPPETRQ